MDSIFLCPLVIKRCHQEENKKIYAKPRGDIYFNIYSSHQLYYHSDDNEGSDLEFESKLLELQLRVARINTNFNIILIKKIKGK